MVKKARFEFYLHLVFKLATWRKILAARFAASDRL